METRQTYLRDPSRRHAAQEEDGPSCCRRHFERLLRWLGNQAETFLEPDPELRAITYRDGLEQSQPLTRKSD